MRVGDGLATPLAVGVPAPRVVAPLALRVSAENLPLGPRPLAAKLVAPSGSGVPPALGGLLAPIPRCASVDGVSPAKRD
jgi:hypothetical protein